MRLIVGMRLRIGLFKYLFLFFYLTLAPQSAISQVNLDSLKQILPNLKGEQKLIALMDLAYEYSFSDVDLQYKYAREGLDYALAGGDSLYVSKFYRYLGYYYDRKHAYQDARNSFSKAIEIGKLKGYNNELSKAYAGMGGVYHDLNLYDKALEYHSESIALKELEGNAQSLAVSYNNMGLIYYKIDQMDRAMDYYKKSIGLTLQSGDTAAGIPMYVNMGLAYSALPDSNSIDQAVIYFMEAIRLSRKYKRLYSIGSACYGLANAYTDKEQYDSARYYVNLSIDASMKTDRKMLESSNYYLLAKIAFLQNNYNTAIDYLSRSQKLLSRSMDKTRQKNNFRLYSEIYEAKTMLDSALVYQKKFVAMKDSIFNEEMANNLAKVQIATIEQQSQQKIAASEEQTEKSKQFSLFLLSILGLSIALIVVIFRYYTNTNKINKQLNESKNEIQAQKENLELKNRQLAEAQITIRKQNEVLKNINIDLDRKVKDRTIELDRSNNELEKAVRDLDQFIYKTSHDLRGPIATMQGIINLGVIDAGDDRSKEYFNTLHKVSTNLNNVLYRLIEVHETYQKKPIVEILDPMKEIMETTNRVSRFSIETDITIITELQANGQWNSDKVLFNMIIENMLRNAIHYKDRGESLIKIKTDYVDENLKIIFEDNGFGIQPGDEDKVFNIFFKGSPRPGGTGLEIYTAKVAVEKLGGEISLRKPLKNTIFEINLPILDN